MKGIVSKIGNEWVVNYDGQFTSNKPLELSEEEEVTDGQEINFRLKALEKHPWFVAVLTPPQNLWWGYLHTSGTIQAKRYFSPLDIQEADESPFCEISYGPFPAYDRDDALQILNSHFKK